MSPGCLASAFSGEPNANAICVSHYTRSASIAASYLASAKRFSVPVVVVPPTDKHFPLLTNEAQPRSWTERSRLAPLKRSSVALSEQSVWYSEGLRSSGSKMAEGNKMAADTARNHGKIIRTLMLLAQVSVMFTLQSKVILE